jgi:hypothetical protein
VAKTPLFSNFNFASINYLEPLNCRRAGEQIQVENTSPVFFDTLLEYKSKAYCREQCRNWNGAFLKLVNWITWANYWPCLILPHCL